MNLRRYALETVTLIVAAVLCATISNALASRERKLALVGTYPNALKVPAATTSEPDLGASVVPVTQTTETQTATVTTATAAPVAVTTAATPPPKGTTATTETQSAPPPPKPPASVDLSKFQPHPDKAYVEIGYADAAALHSSGALVLDARRTSIYEQGHIAGARPFSVWESDVDDKVNKLFEERGDPRDQAKPIVIYCSGGECEDSHMLAQKLWGIQFNNVYVYKDGYPDWQKRGGPVRTGATP